MSLQLPSPPSPGFLRFGVVGKPLPPPAASPADHSGKPQGFHPVSGAGPQHGALHGALQGSTEVRSSAVSAPPERLPDGWHEGIVYAHQDGLELATRAHDACRQEVMSLTDGSIFIHVGGFKLEHCLKWLSCSSWRGGN